MGDKTGIQWTEATWNPVVGCSILTPGCTHCYAMKEARRLAEMGALRGGGSKYAGLTSMVNGKPVWNGTVRLYEGAIDQPLRWKKPRRIFVNSMSDLFHEDLPDAAIDKVFAIMALAPQHTFQVLTKRAERMRRYFERPMLAEAWWEAGDTLACALDLPIGPGEPYLNAGKGATPIPLPNVWLGVSVEDQKRADERIPYLLGTPAAVRFLSCEPLLGPVELAQSWLCYGYPSTPDKPIDWIIVGGESGADARPMHPAWATSLRDQCVAAAVPYFFKQHGAWKRWEPADGVEAVEHVSALDGARFKSPGGIGDPRGPRADTTPMVCVGKKRAGRELDGREWNEMPHGA